MESTSPELQGNLERFSGFADRYDAYRPTPPEVIVDILIQLARSPRPALVADLGSGTGLSTHLWAERAERVIGIEPNPDMRRQAEARLENANGNVRFQNGLASATGLPDGSADIVTCSQSLHWMEPGPTLREVGRILRPGGVFAAYDCDWPPTMQWEAEAAFENCLARALELGRDFEAAQGVRRWSKSKHLDRMLASGHFRYSRDMALHHVEMGNAERLVGLAMSQGSVAGLLKQGYSEQDVGLETLRRTAQESLGDEPRPWYWTYRVRIGIK